MRIWSRSRRRSTPTWSGRSIARISAVDETIYEPVAACYASVLPEDRREGVALVDIGAAFHRTGLLLRRIGAAGHVAADLRRPFLARPRARAAHSDEAATTVKHEFGGVLPLDMPANSMVEIPFFGRHETRPRGRFATVHQPDSGIAGRRIVRDGAGRIGPGGNAAGDCQWRGARRAAARCCRAFATWRNGCWNARRALAWHRVFWDWPDELNDPAWTTAAGLSMYAARLRSQVDLERQSVGMLGRVLR